MIHNVRMSWTYNLPNRNRYEKSVITKKLRIDKNRCNDDYFFKIVIFSAYGKLFVEKYVFISMSFPKVKDVDRYAYQNYILWSSG